MLFTLVINYFNNTTFIFFVHFQTLFLDFGSVITEKDLKRRIKVKTAEKSVLTSIRVRPAPECWRLKYWTDMNTKTEVVVVLVV